MNPLPASALCGVALMAPLPACFNTAAANLPTAQNTFRVDLPTPTAPESLLPNSPFGINTAFGPDTPDRACHIEEEGSVSFHVAAPHFGGRVVHQGSQFLRAQRRRLLLKRPEKSGKDRVDNPVQ
jgi:hypothetical protein